jgi:hypothetical protein
MAAQPIKVYATALWNAQKAVATKIAGTDIRRLPIELRVVLILCDLSISLVIQGLVNAGIFTDAAVQAKLNEIAGSTYPTLPDRVPAPDPDSGYVPPDPDLGS